MSDIIKQGNRTGKTTIEICLLERITELEAERDQLKADLGDACEENGRIVDSSLKDIGALKVELGQLREQWREQKWKVGKLYDLLTKVKGALGRAEAELEYDIGDSKSLQRGMRKVRKIITEALTELDKS